MKKLALSLAIVSALSLSGCGSETIEDVKKNVEENGTPIVATSRVVFDPANGVMSLPNDLLFSGSQDGTLNPPVENPIDVSDPAVAISGLDGWSTTNAFSISFEYPSGASLNALSASAPGSVRIFETLMGGDSSDDTCKQITRGLACKVVGELASGVDFVSKASGNNLTIVPIKPLKAKTSYIVVLTNSLKDTNDKPLAGSSTYQVVREDINEKPLGSETQLMLQGIVNSYENAVTSAGVEKDSIIYTMAMTTQSTVDVLYTAKSLLAAPLAQGGLPPVISMSDTGISVAQAFAMQGIMLPPNLDALYSTANLLAGSVSLPYYSGIPSMANPMAPVNERWKGLCDSGAMLAGLAAANPGAIPEGPLSQADGVCMAVSAAAELPAPGLRDLSSVMALDVERNLTKYSPVPAPTMPSDMPWIKHPGTLDVQMTTPDISPVTDAVRASYGLPPLTAMPASGWPTVILQHGITSKKEDMLAITGILSTFGFATIAIDHPLHGSRGFDLNADGTDDINASTVSATHYMNLASLLTTRDNLRQSTIDMLGLRLGLATLPIIDNSNVHFLGHSLGAITGINFVTLANTPMNELIDGLFAIKTNSLAMPGTMLANFLMESGSFGNVIKSNLTYAQSPEFKAMLDAMYPLDENGNSTATESEKVMAYLTFYNALSDEQQASLNGVFAEFTFAAQTVTDSGDPANYAPIMSTLATPTHLIEVVGNGVTDCSDILMTDNCSDQVIPNTVSTTLFGGTEGAIKLLGLPSVGSTTPGSGAVRFTYGHHSSILSPNPQPSAPDAMKTAAATQEMQGQVVGFFATMGQLINVTNTDVVQP